MKKVRYHNIGTALSSLAVTGFLASVAFANPAMLPKHPGHPMKPLKSPVTGQSLANDPGRDNQFGQEALDEAAKSANENMKLRSKEELRDDSKQKKGQGK